MWQVFQCPQCGAQNYQGQPSCWNCGMQFSQQQGGFYQQPPQQSPQQQYWQSPAQPQYPQQQYQQPAQPPYQQYQQPMQQPGMHYQQPYGYGPQAPQKKGSSSGMIFLICVVVLLFAVAAVGIISEGTFFLPSKSGQSTIAPETTTAQTPEETTDTTPKQTAVKVEAGTLILEYMADEAAADSKYNGSLLEITGMVERNGETDQGLPYVMLGGGGETEQFSTQCIFAAGDKTAVEALTIGGSATIEGTCDGYNENIIVSNCSIK
jgi:hypothetical protein